MSSFIPTIFSSRRTRWPRPSLDLRLIGERVTLRVGDPADWRAWREVRMASRDFLTPWEPSWAANGLTYDFFCGNLRRHWREWKSGTDYAFLVFSGNGQGGEHAQLIGSVALNDIQRGIAQKGTLGYWIGMPYAGQGLMTEAVGLVRDFAFTTLNLHRIEASCIPHNEPSKRLLERLGFEQEGFARSYLKINGHWEDHLLWGLICGD